MTFSWCLTLLVYLIAFFTVRYGFLTFKLLNGVFTKRYILKFHTAWFIYPFICWTWSHWYHMMHISQTKSLFFSPYLKRQAFWLESYQNCNCLITEEMGLVFEAYSWLDDIMLRLIKTFFSSWCVSNFLEKMNRTRLPSILAAASQMTFILHV